MENVSGRLVDGSSVVLALVRGRLKMTVNSDEYEFHLEDALEFKWANNAYGPYARPIYVLTLHVIGKMLYPACVGIASWLSDKSLGELLNYTFVKERRGTLYPLVTPWVE